MQELTDLERRQAEEIGKLKRMIEELKRGQELRLNENKHKAKKIKEQYEELQRQETQIKLMTDQIEKNNEDSQSCVFLDCARDERDNIIADELKVIKTFPHSMITKQIVNKAIKQLRGE